MRKQIGIRILISALMLLCLLGCGQSGAPETTKSPIRLSRRQEEILRQQGLPTDYEALSLGQKSAIESIEDMLCYLEQRYDDHFTYVGYVADSPVEREHLLAESESYSGLGTVTVYRSYREGSFSYEDNYSTLEGKLLYEQALNDWICQFLPEEGFIVFSQLSEADQSLDQEQILTQASAASYVLVDESLCTEESLRELAEDFGSWIREEGEGRASVTIFYRTPAKYMAMASNDSYLELLPELREQSHFSCTRSADGKVKLS